MAARERAVQARAAAVAATNASLLQGLDAFRGVHLDPNASHWDEVSPGVDPETSRRLTPIFADGRRGQRLPRRHDRVWRWYAVQDRRRCSKLAFKSQRPARTSLLGARDSRGPSRTRRDGARPSARRALQGRLRPNLEEASRRELERRRWQEPLQRSIGQVRVVRQREGSYIDCDRTRRTAWDRRTSSPRWRSTCVHYVPATSIRDAALFESTRRTTSDTMGKGGTTTR